MLDPHETPPAGAGGDVPDVAGGDLTPPAAADPVGPPPADVAPTEAPAEQAPAEQADASSSSSDQHQAAAEHVATAGPIVWGDRGEVVQMAAKLLGHATGRGFPEADGTAAPMWSASLSDACRDFQKAAGLVVALPGCVDEATWRALEAAAQGGTA